MSFHKGIIETYLVREKTKWKMLFFPLGEFFCKGYHVHDKSYENKVKKSLYSIFTLHYRLLVQALMEYYLVFTHLLIY
jgi:hypothetical protein